MTRVLTAPILRRITDLAGDVDSAGRAGIAWIDLTTGVVTLNGSAAGLLRLAAGRHTDANFVSAMAGLAHSSPDRGCHDSLERLSSDPSADIDEGWRLLDKPGLTRVRSALFAGNGFNGRLWIFGDDPETSAIFDESDGLGSNWDVESRGRTRRQHDEHRPHAERMGSELRSAADYIASILPRTLDGKVRISSRYLPLRELGGDCFDYGWIDDDRLIVYLIDVSGHGIAPALEAVSVHNLLRSAVLPTELRLRPADLLAELNARFTMADHAENYFSIFYGVYRASTRILTYASAGHPPALAFPPGAGSPIPLATAVPPVGVFADTAFAQAHYVVPAAGRILIYSDGAFALTLADGRLWSFGNFIELCTDLTAATGLTVDGLVETLRERTADGAFDDDLALVLLDID